MSETNTFSLPVEIDGITRDWLETALSGYAPGVRVRDFELVDFIRTTCTKIRIRLDLDNNPPDAPIPPTVILKGGFEPHSRKMWPMHQNEALSYGTLMPQLGLRVPTPYFSGWDEDERTVRVADPLESHPHFRRHIYWLPVQRVINAILLGVLTYDANLLVLEPPEDAA